MEESSKIKVFLNGTEVETFRGMKVKHILSHETVKLVENGEARISDEEGNERGLEGSLANGEHLRIIEIRQ